jgi:hypothetical protein
MEVLFWVAISVSPAAYQYAVIWPSEAACLSSNRASHAISVSAPPPSFDEVRTSGKYEGVDLICFPRLNTRINHRR